ncbi:MAG: ABC transporter permease [Saprospiraceae bacterium]|nr:ABC transporter permease [Saprospiraceae bacterium]
MFDYDKWQEIFETIRKHKLRTFLTALGVWWGIFMLVILMGAGSGLENGVVSQFGSHARNSMYVWTQRTTKPYAGLPAGRYTQLRDDDIQAIEDRFGNMVEYISPRLFVPSGEISYGLNKGAFSVRGETPDLRFIEAIVIVEGRFVNEIDMAQKRKSICIGRRVRDVLFEEEDPLGKYIRINGAEYQVVGVFRTDQSDEEDVKESEETIFMPLTTAQQVTNRPGEVAWFVCTVNPKYRVAELEEGIKDVIRERHKIHPEDPQGVRSNNVEEEFRQIMGLFTGIRILVWIVGIGSLLAGIIGVGNVMLIIVKERTKEIGIRKALGATPTSIISMILMESVFLTFIAGYLGLLASTGMIALLKAFIGDGGAFFSNPQVNLGAALGAMFILVLAGALTGLVPAIQAANIEPVQALKDE